MSDSNKKPKSKGPIRFEVILPLFLIGGLIWAYFFFFFDGHLRRGLEFAGYHTLGAEVNVGSLETSFWKAQFRIQNIQVTNAEKPSHNMLQIGDIRFGLLWDGLLRARFVAEEMAVEQIAINTLRKSPGMVKPPPKEVGPSFLEEKAKEIGDKALDKVQEEASDNVLGDVAAILGGANAGDQLKSIEDSLPSKAKATELSQGLEERKAKWEAKMKTLPQGKDIQVLADKMKKIKTSNFVNPQELVTSVQEFQKLSAEADALFKTISGASNELSADLKFLETGLKDLDALIKSDIKNLEARFRIPSIDAKSLTKGVLKQYLDPYISKLQYYKGLAEKYVPPKYLKKGTEEDPEPEFQPHPRARGVTYEFGRQNSYPLFWIKKVAVSSKANAELGIGDLLGSITHITSNQAVINKPTELNFKGDFPGQSLTGVLFKMAIDTRKTESRIDYSFGVASYPLGKKTLLQSDEVNIVLEGANSSLESKGELVGLTKYQIMFKQNLGQARFTASAKNSIVDEIIKAVFQGLPEVFIRADGRGDLPHIAFGLESNMGPELARGLQAQVSKKIEEAKARIQAEINKAVGQERERINGEINKLKTQFEGELKKVQTQLDEKKKEGEAKAAKTQKDAESKAKEQQKSVEAEAKKRLEQEGAKAIDDLKKKFGL